MNEEHFRTLQWLGEQHFEEGRSLRAAEDNLFNWSTSLFLAGLGALTGLRGLTTKDWDLTWRSLLMAAVVAVVVIILCMAFLIRRNYNRNRSTLNAILTQLAQAGLPVRLPMQVESVAESFLFFVVRWGALAILGVVTLILVWLLG